MNVKILYAKIFLTGGIILGLELAASRILTPFFGVSLYVWSGILSVTLLALALGYKAGGFYAAKLNHNQTLLLFSSMGALSALWLVLCAWTYPFLFWPLSSFDLVFGSVAACLYLLFTPLVFLSALNPLLVSLLSDRQAGGDHGAGGVFFISTVGSVAGVFAVAYGLLPRFTNYQVILLLASFGAALSVLALLLIRDFSNKAFRLSLALSLTALALSFLTYLTGGLERWSRQAEYNDLSWRVVRAEPSYFGNLQIVEIYKQGRLLNRALLNDGLAQNQFYPSGDSASLYTYALEKLALAAMKTPEDVLVFGIGGGVVPEAFAKKDIAVTAIDINPKIVEIAQDHLGFETGKIDIVIADARTAARECAPHDIVALDLFHGDGIPEHLVTKEFFTDIKSCLRDGGVVVMNSFMSASDPRGALALLKTFVSVFGEAAFIQKPPKEQSEFTVAYLVARKGTPLGEFDVSLDGLPRPLAEDFTQSIRGGRIYTSASPELQNAPLLTDISNQWKQISHASDLAYRQSLVSQMPWQVLMN